MKLPISVLLGLLFCFQPFAQNKAADLIILNANVRTMDPRNPRAEAVAIAEGKIIAVGRSRDIKKLAIASTRLIDAKGMLVLPGFNDAHVHFMAVGNRFSSIDLRDAADAEDVVERVQYFARFLPKGRWILGGYWGIDTIPDKAAIEAAAPNNPVFVYRSDAQTALANGAALRLAGIGKGTKLSGLEVDAEGEPTGIVTGTALKAIRRAVPASYMKNWAEIAETATNYAASLGVTSIHDTHSDDSSAIYRDLLKQGKLKTRVYDCVSLANWKSVAKSTNGSSDMVRSGCLKSFYEGDADRLPELAADVLAADKAGFQVLLHAIGAESNDVVLGIYEKVTAVNGPRDRRFRVEHAQRIAAGDFERFARSKIIASVQPYLFYPSSVTKEYRQFLNSGVNLALGSDAAMTELDPLFGIQAAVQSGLTVEEAVRGYTVGSAYAEFQENIKGMIRQGYFADLVILSEDIFSIGRETIKNAKVIVTIIDGKAVYQADGHSDIIRNGRISN